jgi:hypothetical protein
MLKGSRRLSFRAGYPAVLLGALLSLLVSPGYAQDRYPQIDPAAQSAGTPARAVAGFLKGWRENDRQSMKRNLQLSALQAESMADMALDYFLARRIEGAEIVRIEPVKDLGDMLADVSAYVWATTPRGVEKQRWKFRVVREESAGVPSATGIWGVNPVASGKIAERPGRPAGALSPPQSLPSLKIYKESDPRFAVAKVLNHWHSKNWKAISQEVLLRQPPSGPKRVEKIRDQLGIVVLQGARLLSVKAKGNTATVKVAATQVFGGEAHEIFLNFPVMRARSGKWRVNLDALEVDARTKWSVAQPAP